MRGWACLVLICHQQKRAFGGWEEESKPIVHGIDLGTWLQKKLENLSAAPDELDHARREARDFASHFRVSYDIL